MLTPEVASRFSNFGRVSKNNTQKKRFEGTLMNEVIKHSAISSCVSAPGIEKVVEETIRMCLKHVSDKVDGRSRLKS